MSALKDRLRSDLTASIKARDEVRSSTIRMLLTAITNAEVAGKEQRELSDDDIVGVLSGLGTVTVHEHRSVDEDVRFTLPKEVS